MADRLYQLTAHELHDLLRRKPHSQGTLRTVQARVDHGVKSEFESKFSFDKFLVFFLCFFSKAFNRCI
jgi:hypothetical protein